MLHIVFLRLVPGFGGGAFFGTAFASKKPSIPRKGTGLEVCFAAVCCIAGRFFYAPKNKLSFVFAISEKCFYLCGVNSLKKQK